MPRIATSRTIVVGGGVIGLSIARELHKRGFRDITVLEKNRCGEEASWAAAGILGPQAEADQSGPFFDLCCSSRDLYPQFAAELLEETGVDIEIDSAGTLYAAFTEEDVEHIRSRYEWQKKGGLPVELLAADDVRRAAPMISHAVSEALYFPNDWQVENRKLVAALRQYAELNGIDIIENTAIDSLIVENGKAIGAATAEKSIYADQTVLATGAWTSLVKLGSEPMPFEVKPVRGQMIAFKSEEKLFRHVIYSRNGYILPRADGRILAGSTTEDVGFDVTTTREASDSLREMAGKIIPMIKTLAIDDRWAGLRPFAPDGLPVLGRIGSIDGLFIATAHYRNGILLAPVTARIVAQSLLDGVESEYCAMFGPDRFGVTSVGAAT